MDRPRVDIKHPATSTLGCVAHSYHSPVPLYTELHHVIPQAWQRFWRPSTIERPTWKGVEGPPPLWAPDTVPLCRTGHGNLHVLLVKFMRAYGQLDMPDGPERIEAAVSGRRGAEAQLAKTGMRRFQAAGGSLEALCGAGQYGFG